MHILRVFEHEDPPTNITVILYDTCKRLFFVTTKSSHKIIVVILYWKLVNNNTVHSIN